VPWRACHQLCCVPVSLTGLDLLVAVQGHCLRWLDGCAVACWTQDRPKVVVRLMVMVAERTIGGHRCCSAWHVGTPSSAVAI
jgi:hypothetical protein